MMKISVSKTAKKSPLDTVLDELDGLVGGSIDTTFLKRGEKPDAEVEEMMEGGDEPVEVEKEEEVHGEPDGDELPEDLKKALIEALSRE